MEIEEIRNIVFDVFNQVVSEGFEEVPADDSEVWYQNGYAKGALRFCDELMSRIEGGYEVPENEQG